MHLPRGLPWWGTQLELPCGAFHTLPPQGSGFVSFLPSVCLPANLLGYILIVQNEPCIRSFNTLQNGFLCIVSILFLKHRGKAHRAGLAALLCRGNEVLQDGDFSSTLRGCGWQSVGLLPTNRLWRAHQCPLMHCWVLTISQLFYGPVGVSYVPAGLALYHWSPTYNYEELTYGV